MLTVDRPAEGIARLTLDRPEKRNALDAGVWGELSRALAALTVDDTVGAALLTGAGGVAFSAGGDIGSFLALDSLAATQAYERECFGAFRDLERFDKPIVAVVDGFALAGGCELAFACDIVVATEVSSFSVPEVRIGLAAGYASVRFPASVRRHALKSLTLTGRRVDAHEAQRLGLAQFVLARERLWDFALELAAELAAAQGPALGRAKQLIDRRRDPGQLDAVVDALSFLHLTEDKLEGVDAFLAGREPEFRGR